jgi:hypothetical protein
MDWFTEYNKVLNTEWKPTVLKPEEEKQFQTWFKNTKLFKSFKEDVAKENNISVDKVNDSRLLEMVLESGDYDYRGAFKSKITEEVSPYDNRVHWPSVDKQGRFLKSPQHPTTWKEFFMRQNKIDPDELGLSTIEQAKEWQKSQMVEDIMSNPLMQDTTR